jgi:archaellum biogenesis ATPase FlaH
MNLENQQLMLNYLVSSNELYTKVSPILKDSYWDARLKKQFRFIKDYYETYKASPTIDQLKASTGHSFELKALSRHEIKFAESELENFCRNSAIEQAIMGAPSLVEVGNFAKVIEEMKDAITISVNRDIGVDYFSDPENRLKDLAATILPIPTGYVKIDEGLGGGLTRKEMLLVLGAPGYGKSISLSNLAKRLMKRKLNGVYITLELSEKVVAKRFDTMFSGIAPSQVLNNITETSIRIGKEKGNYGKLFIKRMPESSTNANHIRAYLKEFEIVNGFTPDFICLDYLDLMASCQNISAENFFARDKYISEELRSIANDFDLIMLTASQLNRGAQSVESIDDLGQSHIAGGISKINTADNVLAIYPSAQAKARGEMIFKFIKTRSSNGVGNSVTLKFLSSSLTLENRDEDVSEQPSTSKLSNTISNFVKRKSDQKQNTQENTNQQDVQSAAKPLVSPKQLPSSKLTDLFQV